MHASGSLLQVRLTDLCSRSSTSPYEFISAHSFFYILGSTHSNPRFYRRRELFLMWSLRPLSNHRRLLHTCFVLIIIHIAHIFGSPSTRKPLVWPDTGNQWSNLSRDRSRGTFNARRALRFCNFALGS